MDLDKSELLGVARTIAGDPRPKCAKCAHYKEYPPDPALYLFPRTKHRCTKAIDLVTGKPIETDCYAMRHIRGECGPDATYFQDAPAKGEEKPSAGPLAAVEWGLGKLLKALLVGLVLIGLAALALLALAVWAYEKEKKQSGVIQTQPSVIQTGEVSQMREVSLKDGSRRVTARTRLITIGKRQVWQFEASPGRWEDCGDDCEKALRRALAK